MPDANLFSFSVSSDALRKAIKSLAMVVPKMPVPSIIGNILFMLQPDGLLRLQATDLQSHMVIRLATRGASGSGSICIPSERVRSIVDSIKEGDILINVNLQGFDMMVSAGKKDASMKGFDAMLFPSLDQSDKTKGSHATMPIDLFKEMVRKVSLAAAVDDNRPYLTGVQIAFADDKMTMIATDSFRAAFAECEALNQPTISTILPAMPLKNAVETLSELSNINTLSVIILENSVQLIADNVGIQLTPLAGIYPKVRGVFDLPQKTSIMIPTRLFLEAIRFVTSFQGVLSITTEATGSGKGLLKLHCTDGQSGEGSDSIDIALKGNPVKVTMNPVYLEPHIVLYNAMKVPELVLQLNGNDTHMIIRPCFDGDIDETFGTVVMPLGDEKRKKK